MYTSFFMVLEAAPMFGMKHMSGLLMMAALLLMYFIPLVLLKNKMTKNQKQWVLKGTSLFLIFIEIIKYMILLREYGNIPIGEFPMHFCNMPLLLFPWVSFGKSKFAEFLKPAAFMMGLFAGVIALVYPSNILGENYPWFSYTDEYLFPFRSFLFHTVMIMFSSYMLLSGEYKIKRHDTWRALVVMLVCAGIGKIFNWFIPGADYFMLGMGYGSPLNFLMPISKALYILAMMGCGIIVNVLFYLPFELKLRKEAKK